MSASEFAFLALGLVLGVASGAALIEVLRARPPASREIRLTVSPNAIHARMASTLADPGAARGADGPAAGGPGDRRWRDELIAIGEPATTGRRSDDGHHLVSDRQAGDGRADRLFGTPVRHEPDAAPTQPAGLPPAVAPRPVLPAAEPVMAQAPTAAPVEDPIAAEADPAATRPEPLWMRPTPGRSTLVAVPMSLEPDPITTALRASAAASAVAALRTTRPNTAGATATADRPTARTGPSTGRDSAPSDPIAASSAGGRSEAPRGDADPTGAGAGAATPAATPSSDGPCAEERRVADERCAVATRAQTGATSAHDAVRQAQRAHDELFARAEAAAAQADPRAVRTAKETAQREFHAARGSANSRDDVEAGARAWLAEINRINQDTREAVLTAARDRAAATGLAADLERLALEADAARISAEQADEACAAAKEAVVGCDEARTIAASVPAVGASSDPGGDGDDGAGRIAAATVDPEDEFAFATPMASHSAEDAPIVRILRGERDAMQRAVARLAGDDPEARRIWQARLSGLAEALIARSIEASALQFPNEHPFWGPFNQTQCRDIASGLSSLGFRFDGFGGWVDERLPSQRDLAMAVGYAGLDPMRVRHWPNETETRELLGEVRVAADEYVAGAAGGLTLGELLTLLGRRADTMTDLWNEWGTVRPILLEAG